MSFILLGILNSQVSGGVVANTDYELIQTYNLSSSQASVTFSLAGLSSDYQHLQVRWEAVGNRSSNQDDMIMYVNSDTATAGYSYGGFIGDGTNDTLYSGNNSSYYGMVGNSLPAANYSDYRMVGVTTFFDPFETTKNKSWIHQRGTDSGWYGGTGDIGVMSGTYFSTTALSSITYKARIASLAAGCRFSIYGLRSVTSV